jgi:acyl carrier protein
MSTVGPSGPVPPGLLGHPAVVDAAVVDTDLGGERASIAVVTLRDYHSPVELREAAGPQVAGVLIVDALYDGTGALDLAAITQGVAERGGQLRYVPPAPGLEEQLAAVWRECLAVPQVGADDDFLELGGDSMGAFAVIAELERRHGIPVDIFDLVTAATVRDLAALLRSKGIPG